MMEFEYSEEEYTVGDFYHSYKDSLPKLTIVTQGYFGEIGIETYDRGQILRIHTHSAQRRVVAEVLQSHKTASGLEANKLSIPVDFKSRFCVIEHGHKSKKDRLLPDILDKYTLPVIVEFSEAIDHTLFIGAEEHSLKNLCRLRLLETYKDLYLLGNPISDGRLYARLVSVPVYLQDIRLSVVTGLKGFSLETWSQYLHGMAETIERKVTFDTTSGNKNIAAYRKDQMKSGTNYAMTLPCEYYNIGDWSRSDNGKQSGKYVASNESYLDDMDHKGDCIYEPVVMKDVPSVTDMAPTRPPPVRSKPKEKIPPQEPINGDGKRPKDLVIPALEKNKTQMDTTKCSDEIQKPFQNRNEAHDATSIPKKFELNKVKNPEVNESNVKSLKHMFEKIDINKTSLPVANRNVESAVPVQVRRTSNPRGGDYQIVFEYSQAEHSIKDFYEQYRCSLPKVVIVTQGYCGEIGLETYDSGQVLRLHTYSLQKRVVCEVLHGHGTSVGFEGKYLTIPVDYPVKFNVFKQSQPSKSKGKDLSLAEIIHSQTLPVEVQFSKTDDAMVAIDSREISTKHFYKLKLVETYDEVYLVGNPITFGKLYSKILSVPVYLPDIRLSVVTGVKGQSHDAWQTYLHGMNDTIEQNIKFDKTFGNSNIAVYSGTTMDDTEDYTYRLPAEYYNLASIQRPRGTLQSPNQSTRDIYEDLSGGSSNSVCMYEPVSFKKDLSQKISNQQDSNLPPPLQPKPQRKSSLADDMSQQIVSPPQLPKRDTENARVTNSVDSEAKYIKTVASVPPENSIEKKENLSTSKRPQDNRSANYSERFQQVALADTSATIQTKGFANSSTVSADIPPEIDRISKPLNRTKLKFEHGKDELSVKEFYKQHHHELPKLVMVTQGYCGHINLETFAMGEILRIHKYLTQKRAIAEVIGQPVDIGLQGKRLSIPVDFDCQFRVIKHGRKSWKDQSLAEIVKKQLPVEVRFSNADNHKTLVVGPDERNTSHFPHLNITGVYDDLYLLGNPISDGGLCKKIISVPAYLPDMTLAVITGIAGYTELAWQNYLSGLQNTVEQEVEFGGCFGNKDIAMYGKDEVTVDANFSFVSPNVYANLEQLLHGKSKKGSYEQLTIGGMSPNVYEEIPADRVKDSNILSKSVALTTNTSQDVKKSVYQTTTDQSSSLPSQTNVLNKEPFNLSGYSVNDISDSLHLLNLSKYIDIFKQELIDGVILAALTEEDLQNDFGLRRHEAVKLMTFVRTGHVPKRT